MTDLRMIPRQHPVVKAVATALRRRCGVEPRSHLLVAVSGGADSVALLRALHILAHARSWCLRLTVAHVQHHLRPIEQAEGDAHFVQRLAGRLNLPFLRQDLDPTGWHGNVEAQARRFRYQALGEMALACGAGIIATAHHGDDQVETLLMRLLRGASVQGLAAMAWRRHLAVPLPSWSVGSLAAGSRSHGGLVHIRPLLALEHQQLCDFLRALRQRWREDATNQDISRLRARLRHQILPVLRQIRPGLVRNTLQMSEYFRQLDRLLRGLRQEAMKQVVGQGPIWTISRHRARQWPVILLMDVLRQSLLERGVPADRLGQRAMHPLIRAVRDRQGGRRLFAFSGSVMVELTRDRLTLRCPNANVHAEDRLEADG